MLQIVRPPARRRRVRPLPGILLLLAAVACAADDEALLRDPSGILLAVEPGDALVSDPTTGALSTGDIAAAAGQESAFVSLRPGSVPGGETATLTVQRTGASAVASMLDGGFDPVPVQASEGDTVAVEVTFGGSATPQLIALEVPKVSPPRIVRTRPVRGKRDVVLNEIIVVVFSEPVDPATITPATIELKGAGIPVPASLSLSADGLMLELRPSEHLAPDTEHRLTITTAVQDREGEALEQAYSTDFTTGGDVAEGELVFQHDGDVWVMKADGSGQRNLGGGSGAAPEWSPDGLRIAAHDDDIWLINADGTGRTLLVGGPSIDLHPTWSPDGSRIAFSSDRDGTNEIYVIDPDGTGLTQLTFNDSGQFPPTGGTWPDSGGQAPSYSRDGRRIAFYRDDGLWVMNADGTGVVQVTAGVDWEPTWSPEGGRIAFVREQAEMMKFELFVINVDGTGLTQLTFDGATARDPAWSPDGQWIAFASDVDGDFEIFLIKPDGSGLTQLTFNDQDDGGPSWRW